MKQRQSGRARWWLCALALAWGALPAAGSAQVRDTIPQRDTLVAADTGGVEQDSVIPPPIFVPLPAVTRIGPSAGVWEWGRADLMNEGAITLLDLLDRVPGVMPLRAGVFVQPERASALGTGAAHTVVELDGYVLDPLVGPSIDLSAIELVQLESVRIERRGDVLRIRLRSIQPTDGRAYSLVEAGLGEPTVNMFRGMLLVPGFLLGPFGFAIERVEVEGAGSQQPAQVFGSWVKWGWIREDRGIQLEFRNNNLERTPESPIPMEKKRRDVIVRARNRFAPGVVGEVYGGHSVSSEQRTDATLPDSLRALNERTVTQAGARLGLGAEGRSAEAAVRLRNNDWLPSVEAELGATLGLADRVHLTGDVYWQRWSGGLSASGFRAHAELAPLAGLRVFGELASGERGAPAFEDTTGLAAYVTKRTSLRAGIEGGFGRLEGGGALLRVETDSLPTFGLPPDSAAPLVPGGDVSGWEAWGRFRLLGTWLHAAGAYSTWLSGTRWAYLPASTWRAGLDVHAVPLPSGNLEILARVEAKNRGAMLGPPGPEETVGAELPGRTVFNGYLQIRIIDVRIFARLDDMGGSDVVDLPGLPVRGPRFLYGVKWSFWN